MRPYLRTVNFNGRNPGGPKILPIGAGSHEAGMLQLLAQSGYRGPIGVLGHVDADVEAVLKQNLAGLRSLVEKLGPLSPGFPDPAAALAATHIPFNRRWRRNRSAPAALIGWKIRDESVLASSSPLPSEHGPSAALPRPDLFLMVNRMPQRRRSQPEIADIVALAHALDQDQRRTPAELAAREKRLAPLMPHDQDDPVAVGLSWLDMMAGEDVSVRSIHQRADTALHLTGFLIVVIAILLGWGATLGAFYFDGSGRVNAVSVLALLVVVPALFLLPFVIATLPSAIAERVPGVGLVTALAGAVSPGRLAPLLWRVFPRDLRESMALITGRVGKHHRLYASLQKWAVLRWSQLFALTFQLTALAACLVLVVFTDLAFGWSTTLTTGDARIDAQRVHRVTSAMSLPWSWAVDDAHPSFELIEESRYFRVAAEPVSSAQAARLGGWWRFVVLSIAVYGLLPRVITFALAQSRLRAAARAAVVAGPGLSSVLRRIHRAQIESAAIEPEAADEHLPLPDATHGAAARSAGQIRAVINWAGVPVEAGLFARTFPGANVFEAGGAAAVAEDLALAKRINSTVTRADSSVLIVVKAWEPPLMEFIDFLTALRGALSAGATMILVLPVGLDGRGDAGLPAATPAQLNLWRNKLAAVGDPWLRVASSMEEVLT